MAQRRMFSPDIIGSEEFMDMPHSSQSLYMHLAIRADDDGFVQPKAVMRLVGSNADDLKVLIAKRFLLSFETGVVVIKHWLIHNMIRADRYKETRFVKEKSALQIKENKVYTDNQNKGKLLLATKWQPNGNQPAPQVRLGKVSIVKEKEEDVRVSFGEFKKVKLIADEKTKLDEKYGISATSKLIDELDQYIESTGKRYKSHYATLLAWARRKNLAVVTRQAPSVIQEQTPEELAANKERLAKMRASLKI